MTIDPSAIPNFGANEPPPGPPPIVKPDADLIADLFTQMELKFGTDADGDIVASWEGFRLFAMFRGDNKELFAIRTYYDRPYELERKPEILAIVDDWNRETLWPKVYTHTHDDGVVRLIGESQLAAPMGVNIDFFVGTTVSWIQASIGFNEWLKGRLGLEDETSEGGEGSEGDGEGDAGPGLEA